VHGSLSNYFNVEEEKENIYKPSGNDVKESLLNANALFAIEA
jgi:hypothetical protein